MAELKFRVEPVPIIGHGCFSIPVLGVEHLETLWEALNAMCRRPVGRDEDATSAAYRQLASDMRQEVKRGLDLHHNLTHR